MSMRWLLVSSQHHPSHGGIGTYVSRFARVAIDAGWTLDLMTRPGELLPACNRIYEVRTPDRSPSFNRRLTGLRQIERVRPYRYGLWSLAVARRLLDIKTNYDAIEFVDCQAEGYVALASAQVRARFAGVPMIIHAHTPMFIEEQSNRCDMNRFGRRIYQKWERTALCLADGAIVTSRLLGDRLPPGAPTEVIPYPIGQAPLRSPGAAQEQVLLIGSVQPRKGVDVWARSLNRVFAERPDASAILIGPDTPTGPNGGSMAAHVQHLIDPRFQSRFQWRGPLPHDAVLHAIDAAALVVVPSIFESFSFVAAEAIGRGVPVIVSDQVGITEHVDGLSVARAGDAEALASAQVQMLAQPEVTNVQTTTVRARMFEACSPASVLERRQSFVQRIQEASGCWHTPPGEGAIASMMSFLAEVEREEGLISLDSSIVS